ncbi:hypothetical protein JCM10296v2_005676 [Rhodotorula toruloides]
MAHDEPSSDEATLDDHRRRNTRDLEEGRHEQRGRDEKRSQDIAPSTEPRPAMEEPPLETGTASLPPRPQQIPPTEVPAYFKPSRPKISVHSLLIFAAIWGVLARLGTTWIGKFSSSAVFPLVWAQMTGCLVMGFAIRTKDDIEKISPPLFVMLGTGFCGSLTTWSTLSSEIFSAFANLKEPAGTSRFTAFMSGMSITVITLVASLGAFQVGVHLGTFVPSFRKTPHQLPGQLAFNLTTMLIGPLFWLGALFLLIFGPDYYRPRATFAVVLAPPGAVLRYHISRQLNRLNPKFPYGTFACNSISSLLFAVMALLARHPRSPLGCAALGGVQDGFCGCLSTISTMIVELRGLETGQSYRYFIVSWITAQVLFVVVLGSWVWSGDRAPLPFNDRWLRSLSSTMTRLSRCLAASLALLPALAGVALADYPVARDSGFRLALRRRQDNSTSTAASASLDSATAATSASPSPTGSTGQSATDASNATASPTSVAVDSSASYPPSTPTDSAGFVGPTGSASTYVQGAGGESSCVGGGGGSSVRGGVSSSSDLTVLQLAYVLESLESTLYSRALSTFSTSDLSNSGLSQVVVVVIIEQIGSFLRDEQAHPQGCSFNFGRALSDPLEFLAVARAIEAVGQSAYLGAAHLVSDPSLLTAAGSILTVEARHQSFLNLLSGGTFEAQSFDLAFSPAQVLALVGGFLQGCQASDFGLTANQPLSVIDGGSGLSAFLVGSRIEFVTIAQIGIQVLFCQMIVGGAPVALVFPAHSCIVPSGISGPVSVYLTSTSQPLASSTIIQNTAVIVAGPALIFVDVQVTLLSSLFSSFSHGNGRYGPSRSLPSADLGGYAVRAVKEGSSSTWGQPVASASIAVSTPPVYRLDRRRKNKARTLFEDLSS